MQKIKKTHRADPEKNVSQTDFIGPLPQRWRFDHVFRKFEKIFLNYLAGLSAIWKESMQEKGIQST